MVLRNSLYCCLLWLFLSSAAQSAEYESVNQNIASLSYYTENYPPANFVQNGQLQGASIETLKLLWSGLGIPEQNIYLVPWARGYKRLQEEDNAVLFTMSRSDSRKPLFKWVGPVFVSDHVLVSKRDFNGQIKTVGDAFLHDVSTIRGDISEISLIQLGYPVERLVKVTALQQALELLNANRVNLMMVSKQGLYHLLKQNQQTPDDYKIVWNVNSIGNYYAFNRNVPDAVINKLQQVFDQLSKERKMIRAKYNLD